MTIDRLDYAAEKLAATTMDAAFLIQAEQNAWTFLGSEKLFSGSEDGVIRAWELILDRAADMPAAYAEIMEDVSALVHEVNQQYLSMIVNG